MFFGAVLGKFEVCKYVEKHIEADDIFLLKEKIKPFQKEGWAIISIKKIY